MTTLSAPPPRWVALAAAAQSIVTFLVYLQTAYPSISGGDAGELAGVACTGGVAHPPGYPLWLMLAQACLWAKPHGMDPARALNLLSALLSTVAGALLSSTIRALARGTVQWPASWYGAASEKRSGEVSQLQFGTHTTKELVLLAASCGAGALYSFSIGTWEFSGQAEVFALNNALIAAMLRLQVAVFTRAAKHRSSSLSAASQPRDCMKSGEEPPETESAEAAAVATESAEAAAQEIETAFYVNSVVRATAWAAFFAGLALSNQHTSVVYVLLMAPTLIWVGRHASFGRGLMVATKALAMYSAAALLGLAPYLYLPLAAHTKAVDSWGDQRTISGFLHHFLRKEYGTFRLASDLGEQQTWAKIAQRLAVFATRFATESSPSFVERSNQTPTMPLWSPSFWFGSFPMGPAFTFIGAVYLLWPCHREVDSTRDCPNSAVPEVLVAKEEDEVKISTNQTQSGAKKKKGKKSHGTTNSDAANISKSNDSKAYSSDRSEDNNSTAVEWFGSLRFVPGGPLIVVQAIVYSGFINCLANLSFAPLHLNITSRMWQQAYYVGYLCLGVGAARVALLFVAAAEKLDHFSMRSSSGRDSSFKNSTDFLDSKDSHRSTNGVTSTKASREGGVTSRLKLYQHSAAMAVVAIAITAGMAQVHRNWQRMDFSDDFTFRDYGRDLVGLLPPRALLLVNDDQNCNLPHYAVRCEGLRPDVHVVRLPLITYEWWRRMQLHHFTVELPTNNTSSSAANTGTPSDPGAAAATTNDQKKTDKKKGSKKRKGAELTDFGWRVYGVPHSIEALDLEHASLLTSTTTSSTTPSTSPATAAKDAWASFKPHKSYGKVDKTSSLAFPGQRHHPHEVRTHGSFAINTFLLANLKHRSGGVFVAGDFKSGDESWTTFPRIKRGLVDQLFLPGVNLAPHEAVLNGMQGANGTGVAAPVALLPAELPDSLKRSALALPGHVASPWASSQKMMKKDREKKKVVDDISSSSSDSIKQQKSHEASSPPPLALEMGNWDYIVATKYYEGLFRTAQTLAEQINHLQPPKLPLSIATSKSLSNSGADVAAGNNHGANVDDLKRVKLLRAAREAYLLLAGSGLCGTLEGADFWCMPMLWKNAGVCLATLAADLDRVAEITTSAIKSKPLSADDEMLTKEVSSIREEAKSAFELAMRFWVKMIDESPLPLSGAQKELLPALKDAVNPFASNPRKRPLPWLTKWVKSHSELFN